MDVETRYMLKIFIPNIAVRQSEIKFWPILVIHYIRCHLLKSQVIVKLKAYSTESLNLVNQLRRKRSDYKTDMRNGKKYQV